MVRDCGKITHSALQEVARKGHADIVSILKAHRVGVNSQDLLEAVEEGNADLVATLLEAGAKQ